MIDLAAWNSFYVILGSSAGALTGLQFVVMTLITQKAPPRAEEAHAAFATPTIVHFAAVLLLSALLSAPWQEAISVAWILGFIGVIGVVYMIVVAGRMRVQTAYATNFWDWIYYVLLPLGAYAILALSAFLASSHMTGALFGVGAVALLLLFIGIRNAWDSVIYLVLYSNGNPDTRDAE
jgi:F0F1-type ATP synthase assembly protein I